MGLWRGNHLAVGKETQQREATANKLRKGAAREAKHINDFLPLMCTRTHDPPCVNYLSIHAVHPYLALRMSAVYCMARAQLR